MCSVLGRAKGGEFLHGRKKRRQFWIETGWKKVRRGRNDAPFKANEGVKQSASIT